MEVGPGVSRSHLISAVELGCSDTTSLLFLYALFLFCMRFSFFLPFPIFHRESSSQDRLATTIAN
jgi:hypothetical protein